MKFMLWSGGIASPYQPQTIFIADDRALISVRYVHIGENHLHFSSQFIFKPDQTLSSGQRIPPLHLTTCGIKRALNRGVCNMAFVTTKDSVSIFFKDWGPKTAQPIVFHHGWPLSADDWDNQMLFFLAEGFRVIAIDRRGHGRSDQVSDGHDMDHYAADVSAVVEHLDLYNAVHIGHSTGGGQVARYVAQYGQPHGRVAKAVLISAVPPLMVKTQSNPGGTPVEVFDGFRQALAANRAQFYLDVASGPFYGFNREARRYRRALFRTGGVRE
jgi:pimeloyl-ACP methyl ester carboxylesterase